MLDELLFLNYYFRKNICACGLLLLLVGGFPLVVYLAFSGAEKAPKTSNWFDDCSTISDCNYQKIDLLHIIDSAVRVLDFIENHLDEITVIDGAIGTRVLEAQLNLFQLGHSNLPPTFQELLADIKFRCKRLSDAMIDKMISREMPTIERQKLVRNLYWTNDTVLWESPSSTNWQSVNEADFMLISSTPIETMELYKELYSEEISDECIYNVYRNCNVSTKCGKLFFEQIPSCYSLTHQILFFLFAKKRNCFSNTNFRLKMGDRSPEEFMHQLCNKVWDEAHAIQESGFPDLFRDLLSEQIFVCSLAGYTKFLKPSWLTAILSWQSETGCFARDAYTTTTAPENTNSNRRVKRSDNSVGSCSVHFTSVALSAIAMNLRYFGDTCLANY